MGSVDYYSFVTKERSSDEVLQYLGRFGFEFVSVRGSHGYRSAWASEGVRVYFDGGSGMGVYVQVSGEGCARLASSAYFGTWGGFAEETRSMGAKCNRVDIAFDDKSGTIPQDELFKSIDAGEFTSVFRKVRKVEDIAESEYSSRTRYLGSIMSEKSLCVYDKRLEQISRGLPDPGSWLRLELRFKGKVAEEFASWLVVNPDLNGVAGFLRAVVTFTEASGDSNNSRKNISSWWEEFLQESEKLRVTLVKPVRTVEQQALRFVRQHSATLAMLVLCLCEGRIKGKWLDDMIITGWSRMSKAQCAVVTSAIGHMPGQRILLHEQR